MVSSTQRRSSNLQQIAQEAGVSMMTVSRALNNRGYVADDTRLTSSPFPDPSGMFGFLTLASRQSAGFCDGSEALYGRTDCVGATAG